MLLFPVLTLILQSQDYQTIKSIYVTHLFCSIYIFYDSFIGLLFKKPYESYYRKRAIEMDASAAISLINFLSLLKHALFGILQEFGSILSKKK